MEAYKRKPIEVSDLRPGTVYETTNYGLVMFERWDTYMGQTTAEIRLLDCNERRNPFPYQLVETINAARNA